MVLISIIVPVYNTEQYVERCLNSILASNYPNYEVIMVNDGSTDKSAEICEAFSHKDNRFVFLSQSNSGVSAARNLGLQHCNGEKIVFIDSDDVVSPLFLELIAKNAAYDAILFEFDTISNFKDKIDLISDKNMELFQVNAFILSNTILGKQIMADGHGNLRSPWAKAYTRSIIQKYNLYFLEDLTIGEDELFNLNYYSKIREIAYFSIPVYFVEARNDSATHKYQENLLEIDIRFQTRMREYLECNHFWHDLSQIYYYNVCSSIVYVLKARVFNVLNGESFKEKCAFLDKMQGIDIYNEALSKRIEGNMKRRLLLFFYQHRMYHLVELAIKLAR